jgi:UDP-glucose 4-epimerase
MNVLVTGAAGYIGSHAVRALLQAGHQVVALDNLSRGHRAAVPSTVPFIEADVRDGVRLLDILRSHRNECVLHLAALAYVGESVDKPLLYYDNNTAGTSSFGWPPDAIESPSLRNPN